MSSWNVNLSEIYSIPPAAARRSVFANQSNDVLRSNRIPVSTMSSSASLTHFGNHWLPLMVNSPAHMVGACSCGHRWDAVQPNLSARPAFSAVHLDFSLFPSPQMIVASKPIDSRRDKCAPFAVPLVQLSHDFSKKDQLLMKTQYKLNMNYLRCVKRIENRTKNIVTISTLHFCFLTSDVRAPLTIKLKLDFLIYCCSQFKFDWAIFSISIYMLFCLFLCARSQNTLRSLDYKLQARCLLYQFLF